MPELQFWLQVLNIGLAVALAVAGHRGYVVWRWHYNQMLEFLQRQYEHEHEARLRAERNEAIMRDMLFEALGMSKAVIAKIDATNGPVMPPAPASGPAPFATT